MVALTRVQREVARRVGVMSTKLTNGGAHTLLQSSWPLGGARGSFRVSFCAHYFPYFVVSGEGVAF